MKIQSNERSVLLSIQPRYADKIFEGSKRVELRRRFPSSYAGNIVLLYVSTPIKAIVGGFQISHVVTEEPSVLWEKVKDIAGVSFEQFVSYYSGTTLGYGIFIERAWKYSDPVDLRTLKNLITNFSVPQNFRYFCNIQAGNLNLLDIENR